MYRECRARNARAIGRLAGQEVIVKTNEKGKRELVGILQEVKDGSLMMYAKSVFVRSSELGPDPMEADIVEVRYTRRVEIPLKSITRLHVHSQLVRGALVNARRTCA